MSYPTAILVLSDSRAAGVREDRVIPACRELLAGTEFAIVRASVIPDDRDRIAAELRTGIDRGDVVLIVTSGGTGFGPRDVTPEATRDVIEREAPGLAELLRLRGLDHTPRSALTRGICGIARGTLIINLPGSPRAVREGLETLLPILPHALDTMLGQTDECARESDCIGGEDQRSHP